MEAVGVDPRDQTWELDEPRYRVYFCSLDRSRDEYELRCSNVKEALDWAESQRRDRAFVLYACVPQANGLGLVRLLGRDPNEGRRLDS